MLQQRVDQRVSMDPAVGSHGIFSGLDGGLCMLGETADVDDGMALEWRNPNLNPAVVQLGSERRCRSVIGEEPDRPSGD